jgi:hypothetical protein
MGEQIPMKMRLSGSFLMAWLLTALVLLAPIALFGFRYLRNIERIRENPATATGIYIDKSCENEAIRCYAFEVEGKHYQGGASNKACTDCEAFRIGKPILVVYEKGNPINNTTGDPLWELWNNIISMLSVALLFPPLIIWRFRRWRAAGMPWSWGWS